MFPPCYSPAGDGFGAASPAPGYSSEVNQELEEVPAAAGAVVSLDATLTPSRALLR
jgi:hypothetical protein